MSITILCSFSHKSSMPTKEWCSYESDSSNRNTGRVKVCKCLSPTHRISKEELIQWKGGSMILWMHKHLNFSISFPIPIFLLSYTTSQVLKVCKCLLPTYSTCNFHYYLIISAGQKDIWFDIIRNLVYPTLLELSRPALLNI